MNIAILTPSQNPYSETFIQAHKNYLPGNIFYYYGGGTKTLENQAPIASRYKYFLLKTFQKITKKPKNYARDYLLLRSFRKFKIDVVLVEYGNHANRYLSALRNSKLPFVVHFHGYDASVGEVIKANYNYKEVFKYATKIVAVSRKMEQKLLELGCPREKLVYNVYGPQPEFLKVQPQFLKKQFVAIGRFTDKKAPYYSLLAFSKVVDRFPEAKLIMAGAGTLQNTCVNLAKFLKINEKVEFVGIISPEKYRALLAESLAFVQHSITAENGNMEGTPLAVLEASAAGLPVISTNHAGIPDVIIHGETGLLCEEHDVDAMAKNMISALDDKAFAKQLGQAGKKNIQDNFNMERHIDTLQNTLEAAIHSV